MHTHAVFAAWRKLRAACAYALKLTANQTGPS